MKTVYKQLVLSMLPLILISCVKVDDSHLPEKSPLEQRSADFQETGHSLDETQHCAVLAGRAPNSYSVECPVEEAVHVVQREEGVKSSELEIPSHKTKFVDSDVVPGRQYTYKFGAYQQDGKFQQHHSDSVTVPKDLVIKGVFESKTKSNFSWTGYNRIFFEEGSRVLLNGFDLRISAGEVIFNNSLIRSFEQGSQAADGQAGRNGGDLRITAQKISGDVVFDLSGQNGGCGKAGEPPAQSTAQPAIDGVGLELSLRTKTCLVNTAPSSGVDGLNGLDGHPGGPGGNSGTITLNAKDISELKYRIESKPGIGGEGGAGGPGQLGSPRGKSACQNDNQALKDGRNGNSGRPGARGLDGRKSESCFFQDGKLVECI